MKSSLQIAFLAITALATFPQISLADGNRPLSSHFPRERGNERSEYLRTLETGAPAYGGSGCPKGSVSVAFAPDNLSFSVIYDKFVAGASGRKFFDYKTCSMVIPIRVPEGMKLSLTRVDYRGFVSLPDRTSFGYLRSLYGFIPKVRNIYARGPSSVFMNHTFTGPSTEDYFLSTDTLNRGKGAVTESSNCGGTTYLRLENSLILWTKRGTEAQLTLDGLDGAGRSVYFMNWEKCRR